MERSSRAWLAVGIALSVAALTWAFWPRPVAVEVAEERRRSRGGMEEIFESRELQARLCEVYRHAELLVPHDRVAHVTGEGAVSDVAAAVLNAVIAVDPGLFAERPA